MQRQLQDLNGISGSKGGWCIKSINVDLFSDFSGEDHVTQPDAKQQCMDLKVEVHHDDTSKDAKRSTIPQEQQEVSPAFVTFCVPPLLTRQKKRSVLLRPRGMAVWEAPGSSFFTGVARSNWKPYE